MLVVRSFDVNKPGGKVSRLAGGVAGGSIVQGVLRVGIKVEVRPGLVRADGSYWPITSHITSLFSEKQVLTSAIPGGLIGVGLRLDPSLTKGDRLVGQVLGQEGSLPPVASSMRVRFALLRSLVGEMLDAAEAAAAARTALSTIAHTKKAEALQNAKRKLKIRRPKPGETLLLCIASARTKATVINSDKRVMSLKLSGPVCCEVGSKLALFRSVNGCWRLLGSGHIEELTEAPKVDFQTWSQDQTSSAIDSVPVDYNTIEHASPANASGDEGDNEGGEDEQESGALQGFSSFFSQHISM
jgi:translation initiation factor 2 subunit 3